MAANVTSPRTIISKSSIAGRPFNGSPTERNVHVDLRRPQHARPSWLEGLIDKKHRANNQSDVVVEVQVEPGSAAAKDVLPGHDIADDVDFRKAFKTQLDIWRHPASHKARLLHFAIAIGEERVV